MSLRLFRTDLSVTSAKEKDNICRLGGFLKVNGKKILLEICLQSLKSPLSRLIRQGASEVNSSFMSLV